MPDLSTTRTTTDTAATHVADHNTLHAMNNVTKAAGRVGARANFR